MDAAAADADVKLYKSSDRLLEELRAKLPLLVRSKNAVPSDTRRRVLYGKEDDLAKLLDSFQGWPQLLDPYLVELISVLTNAFLTYTLNHADCYHEHVDGTIPLPRAICRLLYAFCKVRGRKVIVRLFQNEPRYVEPMVLCFRSWSTSQEDPNKAKHMVWEEHYVILLWLSHLMLAPFELASISSLQYLSNDLPEDLPIGLPDVSKVLLSLSLAHLYESSKAQDSAAQLAIRLALRRDMQAVRLPEWLAQHAVRELTKHSSARSGSTYQHIGNLLLLYGLMNSGSDHDVVPFMNKIFKSCLTIATSAESEYTEVRGSAPARKLLVKIIRATVVHALALTSSSLSHFDLDVDSMLEESIQYYLDAVADRDTPVRMAVSKALSMVTLKLNSSMAAEVVEAILSSLQENILVEDPSSKTLLPLTNFSVDDGKQLRRNLSAVDPSRWHGLMLTLGHLLFRRSLPHELLHGVVETLLFGLEFEQRSNVGTSLGVAVRDAANFGIWAMARKYTSAELNSIIVAFHHTEDTTEALQQPHQSTLQLVATRLVVSACLDPSGNVRRGSSAALQELIGRHPDTINAGIPLVQAVDYLEVARRSRAMTEVATLASELGPMYRQALLDALLGWRGAEAVDAESRRWAASSLRNVSVQSTEPESAMITFLQSQLKSLKVGNVGSTAAKRHGKMLALSAALQSSLAKAQISHVNVQSFLRNLPELTGDLAGRSSSDLELVAEACAILIRALLECMWSAKDVNADIDELLLASVFPVLERCTAIVSQDAIVAEVATANVQLLRLLSAQRQLTLLDDWLLVRPQKTSGQAGKARIITVGNLLRCIWSGETEYSQLDGKASTMISHLTSFILEEFPIETKVDVMHALGTAFRSSYMVLGRQRISILNTLLAGLCDYTNDQRGDIGSLLRLESLDAFDLLWTSCHEEKGNSALRPGVEQVVRLATEKLNKVRIQAWQVLKHYWGQTSSWPQILYPCPQPEDVCSDIYFAQMATLLEIEWLRQSIVTGFISSTTGGTDEVGRASLEGLLSYLSTMDDVRSSLVMTSIWSIVSQRIKSAATTDDKDILSVLDFATILIEQRLWQPDGPAAQESTNGEFWDSMQKLHGPSASVQRTEACVRLYAAFTYHTAQRVQSLDRLTRLLLHRWPKVRQAAADVLYLHTSSDVLVSSNLNGAITDIKPTVVSLRKHLGVSMASTARA